MAQLQLSYMEIILALLCYFIFWYIRQKRCNYLKNYHLLGMLPSLLTNSQRLHQGCTHILSRAGGTFHFKGPWFTNMDVLLTVDPSNIHFIMSSNFLIFPKGPKFMKIFDVLGDGIFNVDGELWKMQRRLAKALITHQRFSSFLARVSREKIEDGLIPILEYVSKEGVIVNLQDLFQRLTFDTTCKFVTGYDPGCLSVGLPEVAFSKAMDDAEDTITLRHVLPESVWKLQRWLRIGQERKMFQAWKTLDDVIGKYIDMKRKELNKGSSKEESMSTDLLTSYMKANETKGLNCDDNKFLRDTILNLMIAGRDTTSSALTWFIWLVSTHPHIQAKIRDELTANLEQHKGKKRRIYSPEETNKLVYLHGAICEALRLYPPVPFQHKAPIEAVKLPSGHLVHPKMKVMFSLYAMGRMKSIWGKDCLEFKPERWISERGRIKHEPSYKFLSFNAGPRTCIGREIAFTQMKVIAANIIHNYQVEVVEGHPIEPNVSVILYMKHGLKVKVNKRW